MTTSSESSGSDMRTAIEELTDFLHNLAITQVKHVTSEVRTQNQVNTLLSTSAHTGISKKFISPTINVLYLSFMANSCHKLRVFKSMQEKYVYLNRER